MNTTREQDWKTLGRLVKETTGRTLIGTNGGLYAFTPYEMRIPRLDIEAGVHELCHYVVASPEERKQDNMGLSTDWTHPRFDRMVRCEELVWSLEFYLFGDPSVAKMAGFLTPEARASGGGVNITSAEHDAWLRGIRERSRPRPEDAALAEAERAQKLVRDQKEALRREALQKAEQAQLRVKELKALIQSTIDRQAEAIKMLPDLERELRVLEGPESPHCPVVKDGFTCDRTGDHVEHVSEDVRGRVLRTWVDPAPVRNALVDLKAKRQGLKTPQCIRCKVGVSNTHADYELRVQAANRKTRERGGSWRVEAEPLFCFSCQCSCGCEEYLSSKRSG